MELFKYRSLALACGSFLAFLLVSYYLSTVLRIATLALAGVAIFILVIISIIKHKVTSALIRMVPVFLAVILAMSVALIVYERENDVKELCNGEKHIATLTITNVSYTKSYMGSYTARVNRVDDKEYDFKVNLTAYGEPMELGDVIIAEGYLKRLPKRSVGFDSATYNLGKGIICSLETENYDFIGKERLYILNLLDRINRFLDHRLTYLDGENAYPLLSALFLGNKDNLDPEISNIFSRIGLSHILALSGMHITIVVTFMGMAVAPLPIRRLYKELLLIFATVVFVGMTGFYDSAVRAGIMVCLTYLFSFFGSITDNVTNLFLSVTLMCIFDPYSIFSLSLILSFTSMLGCIISSRLMRRLRLYKRIRLKILRYTVTVLIVSLFAILFTMPILFLYIGNVTVLSPITNLIIAPFFTPLIYLCPVYIIFAKFPLLGEFIGFICRVLADFVVFMGRLFASVRNIVIPILDMVQIIGVIVITLAVILFLVVNRKYLVCCACGILIGIAIFSVGTGMLYHERNENVYTGAYSLGNDDYVFLEDDNALTIIDISKTAMSDYSNSVGLAEYLGYYEIENYVITDYSSKTDLFFKNLCKHTVIRNVFLPMPADVDEVYTLNEIRLLAKETGVNILTYENSVLVNNINISFSKENSLPRSTKRAVSFTISYGSTNFTYLGASTYDILDYAPSDMAYKSDICIFGGYGPSFKTMYYYQMPYLDYLVFLGSSKDFAKEPFINAYGDREIEFKGYPIRFKLDF